MAKGKIVLITAPYDQGDILKDFLDWHLDLGIDLILALDHGSTDGSRELLEEYAHTRAVVWIPLPERNISKYSPADELAAKARDEYSADWIIHCDVDEFLCTRTRDLRTILAEAERSNTTLLDIPRHGMTGPPLGTGQRATQALTLRIDRPVETTEEQRVSGELPAPFIFIGIRGHLAVRASAFEAYGPGAENATTTVGESATSDELYILHYAMRGYETLETKVRNTAAFLKQNPDLPPGWGWHWRRWIRLQEQGRLREDYEREFVSAERAQELIADGTCVYDCTVINWLKTRERGQRKGPGRLVKDLVGTTLGRIRREARH